MRLAPARAAVRSAWSIPTTRRSSCRPSMPAALADYCRRTRQPVPGESGSDGPLCPGKPGPVLSLGAGPTGRADRPASGSDPRGRRRQSEYAALPVHRRRLQSPGAGRPRRGDGHRQRAGAGAGPGPDSARWPRPAKWCAARSRSRRSLRSDSAPGSSGDFRKLAAQTGKAV